MQKSQGSDSELGLPVIIGRNFAFQNGLSVTIKQLALTVHELIP